ncbi:MAG: sugar phosphate isomerase/epimerase family protein [Verrucomicrobiota bacterium]
MNRRNFLAQASAAAAAPVATAQNEQPFRLRYILSSAMYGEMPLEVIMPEVKKTGAEGIDIWCKVHGNQREQIDEMGDAAFAAMLEEHGVKFGVSTRYPLGPFGLQEEMAWAQNLNGEIVLCGSRGPREPSGQEAKVAVREFLEKMKPHVAKAEELGMTIAIENHDRQLLYTPDSLRYFAEFNQSPHLGVAFALHHLYNYVDEIPALIRDLGDEQIPFVYFQEHSAGIREKAPKEIEMQQMPGYGNLDYVPILAALKEINYSGYVEIFMHPVPRGIPILPTVAEVTGAINTSRDYLENCLKEVNA